MLYQKVLVTKVLWICYMIFLPFGQKQKQFSSSHFSQSFEIWLCFLSFLGLRGNITGISHHSKSDIVLGEIMHPPAPHLLNRAINMRTQQRLFFLWVLAEWVVKSPVSSLGNKKRCCQSQWMCLPKVGLEGILPQRAGWPDSTEQQIWGIIILDNQQKLHSRQKIDVDEK